MMMDDDRNNAHGGDTCPGNKFSFVSSVGLFVKRWRREAGKKIFFQRLCLNKFDSKLIKKETETRARRRGSQPCVKIETSQLRDERSVALPWATTVPNASNNFTGMPGFYGQTGLWETQLYCAKQD